MNKKEFLSKLRKSLSALSRAERKEQIAFYSEMIDDRMEEGLSEADAVKSVGSAEEISSQIISEKSSSSEGAPELKKNTPKSKWERVFLIIGSPLWIAILIIAFALIFAIYAVIWSIVAVWWGIGFIFFILSYLSKVWFAVAKEATRIGWMFTKGAIETIKNNFKRKA